MSLILIPSLRRDTENATNGSIKPVSTAKVDSFRSPFVLLLGLMHQINPINLF